MKKIIYYLKVFQSFLNGRYGYILCATVIIFLIIFAEFGVIPHRQLASLLQKKSSLSGYADAIIAQCASSDYRPGCYDKEVPKLMDVISMEDAFKVTALVQQKDSDYWYCHVLGHNLSGRETAKDPEKWKEVIPRCPIGTCSNGCIHGALQERFRKENFSDEEIDRVLPDLVDICEEKSTWHPTGMEQATCYHALGHLLMYVSSADTKKSVELCESVAQKPDGRDFLTVCYDGVFMQLFQPLEPEDFALVKGKVPSNEILQLFCSVYTARPRASCWSEGWPLYADQVKNPQGLIRFCSALEEGAGRERCYNGMFFVIPTQFRLNREKIISFCREIPLFVRGRCFANGAGRMIETDTKLINESLAICKAATTADAGDECYDELVVYSQFNFHAGSDAQKELCNGLPDKWGAHCGSAPASR